MSKKNTIAALLRKARDPAATIAEMNEAMALAVKLANREGLSLKDIESDNEESRAYGQREWESAKDHLHPIDKQLAPDLAKFTCCKVYRRTMKGAHYVVFFGHDADLELASYLRDMFKIALENDWQAKKVSLVISGRPFDMRAERQSFCRGFCDKVRDRLEAYNGMRKPTTGTDLVEVKQALLVRRWDEFAKERNIHLEHQYGRPYTSHSASAYAAGQEAGARVSINDRSMGGSAKRIGKE